MSDCETGHSTDRPLLKRPASWQEVEEYERWLAKDAARRRALSEMPQHLSVFAAAEFLHLTVADVRRAIENGELATVTVAGERHVITRVLLEELGVRLEDSQP